MEFIVVPSFLMAWVEELVMVTPDVVGWFGIRLDKDEDMAEKQWLLRPNTSLAVRRSSALDLAIAGAGRGLS
jgi:hypothetical protein